MALYTLTPEVWRRGTPNYLIRIRPAGWMPHLGGALRSYGPDRETFARDLARFLSYTAQDIEDLLRPGATARHYEHIELSDEDAGYLQWSVESTKRVYIELEIKPLPQKHTRDVFTVTVLTAEGQPLSRALPLKASVLLQLLALINPEQTVQFVWQRAIEQMEPFSAVTVPHLWAFALSSEGIDLATWLQHPMPAMQPILVFADAIRIDVF
ncbi:MAG TPA: hypothetical protein VKV02_01615, partial [Acidobacteriaceae bacterium]|nr:hypothetical protein [Acidobacteriaceae bacterium]